MVFNIMWFYVVFTESPSLSAENNLKGINQVPFFYA